MKNIGSRIKETRKEKKWNQEQLAKKMSIGRSSISQWETGITKEMLGENLINLASALGVKPDWLRTGKGEKHWKEVSGSMDSYHGSVFKPPERKKLDEILDAADKAIQDTGKVFTKEERLELYLDGIRFALNREFPSEFVEQYMQEIIKEKI